MITSTTLRSALRISSRNVHGSHVRQMQSFAYSDSLYSDFSSDDTSPLIDERILKHLTDYNPSDLDAQLLRSRLPPQIKLTDLGAAVGVPKRVKRTMPRMEVDVEDVVLRNKTRPLPNTINDIDSSHLEEDARAIVVTETKSPFRVTQVNSSWEALCGYQREECKGRPLGSLLNGPETDKMAATALVSNLLSGEEAGVILTNYTKTGRKFKNYVRVGPVVDEMGKTINFVGVLKKVVDAEKVMDAPKSGGTKLPFIS
mmetsp:Transcript_28482/g.57322  ORF Transcript_28482/g.57322 Transcript_28482/m.57322 type:complete len:257 (+) Transcript_28482:104-874(+)